ncbi:MAG: protein-tyrosine phosphatase [Myxococcota bacterium]|jgi:protein-tyrosine phosphatase
MLTMIPSTAAGGKLYIGRAPRLQGARLAPDDLDTLRAHQIGCVVCLLEVPDHRLQPAIEAAGMAWVWCPVEDYGVPSAEQHAVLAERIAQRRQSGCHVYVHCMAGLGRSGTIAACTLVEEGLQGDQAIDLVRRARPGAIETDTQEAFIRQW